MSLFWDWVTGRSGLGTGGVGETSLAGAFWMETALGR